MIERSVALSSTNIILSDSLVLSVHKKRWMRETAPLFDPDEVSQGVSLDNILEEIEKAYLLMQAKKHEKGLNITEDLNFEFKFEFQMLFSPFFFPI